jgi:hypothetical protein
MTLMTRTTSSMSLSAPTPQAWWATHLHRYFAGRDEESLPAAEPLWVDVAAVVADEGALVRDLHRQLLAAQGGTAQMAAKWIVDWYAGTPAGAVGFVLATADAGVLLDPDTVRLRLDAEGWVDRVDVTACTVVVTDDHPWAGLPGVQVAANHEELVARTVTSLIECLVPVVETVRGLAKVGARALWAEISDALGLCLTYQPHVPVQQDSVDRLSQALTRDGVPWRSTPTLRVAQAPWGPAYLGQKAGCCLAYQRPAPEPVPVEQQHPDQRAFEQAFPLEQSPDRFCGTCSLRDRPGCEARQLWWLQRHPD